MKTIIYLADLSHNYASKGTFTFPINIGYIASYAKKIYGDRVEIQLFKFPHKLISAVKTRKPHIVGLSNYTWNLDINSKISFWLKSISPDIITVLGGPDYPASKEEHLSYLLARPHTDFYVNYQGELGFANIIERFLSTGSIKNMKTSALQNCSFLSSGKDTVISAGSYKFIEDLDTIPSPYLEGLLDDFFGQGLNPLIETNRGCPYCCTYCAWGQSASKKVLKFSLARIKAEIEYIAQKSVGTDMLMLADANFGLFERDVEIAGFIRRSKEQYGYPGNIFVAWAKGSPKRLIKMIGILGDIFGTTSTLGSFQTLDRDVMKNIKRTNLSLGDFKKLQDYFKERNISTSSELILGLPGETKASHLKGLRDMFNFNASGIFCYNLRMIGGSELNTLENRKKYGIKTKFRLVDGGFGKYSDILSIEHEEMVLGTGTMTMDDILYFRPIHFLVQFLWNYKYYEELLAFLKISDINPIDFILVLMNDRASAPPSVKELLDDFMKDTYTEWFDTKEDLFGYYSIPENFEKISKGMFGKLNFKYTYRILLECKTDFDEYLLKTALTLFRNLGKTGKEHEAQLKEILKYIKTSYIDFSKGLETAEGTSVLFEYDILKWKKDAYRKALSGYSTGGTKYVFSLPEAQKTKLRKLYTQYKGADANQTLRKMAEYMNERDLFYKVDYS